MFLKFWIISTIICAVCFFSSLVPMWIEVRKEFTKEELKRFNKVSKKGYPWFINIFLFVCPIVNIIFVLSFGFNYQEIKEKQFKDIRKAIGKQTTADVVSDALDKVLRGKEN